MYPIGDFQRDTALTPDPDVPGRSSLDMSPAWNVFYTFGGMTMAVALRAAFDHIERDDLHPLTANAVFCSPIGPGHVRADVTTLRAGKSATNVSIDLRQGAVENPALRMEATFAQRFDTHMAYDGISFPADVRPPDECPVRPAPAEGSRSGNPFPILNFDQQTDWRPAMAGFTWEEGPAEHAPLDARFAAWFRLLDEPRLADGTIDPISYCVPADMLGAAVARRMGPIAFGQPFFVLSLEINLQFFATTDSPWMLQNVVSQHAYQGYAYGTTELWDGHRRLVGFATQRARLRPFKAGEAFGPR